MKIGYPALFTRLVLVSPHPSFFWLFFSDTYALPLNQPARCLSNASQRTGISNW